MHMKLRFVAIAFLVSLTFAAHSEGQNFSRTGKGAMIGGALGLDAGAVIGAGAGALTGAVIGKSLERRDRGWPAPGYGDPSYYGDQYYYGDPYYGNPNYYNNPYYLQRFARRHRHHH